MPRIRSVKPDYWKSEPIDPSDRQSWKRFGSAPAGREFLYLLSDADERLVYVGITWNPFVRWTAHARKHQDWWPTVAAAEVWLCQNDRHARDWETRCIVELRPSRNIHQVRIA